MSRRFHTDTRTSENFTETGLVQLTGQPTNKWGRYAVKELLDNALEAAADDRTPTVGVEVVHAGAQRVSHREDCPIRHLTVWDDGPGINRDRLEEIFGDVDQFGGTKQHYALPTRGAQGNALMTLLGIQSLCGEPLRIRSNGHGYQVRVVEDTYTGRPEVVVEEDDGMRVHAGESTDHGLSVTVTFNERYGWLSKVVETVRRFGALNPHTELSFTARHAEDEDEDALISFSHPASGGSTVETLSLASNATTGKATWFSHDGFTERLKADIRAAPDLTVETFIREFAGLTSRPKADEVLGGHFADGGDAPISTAVDGGGGIDGSFARALHNRMIRETKPFSESGITTTLGSVGDDLAKGARAYVNSTDELHPSRSTPSQLVDRLRDEGRVDEETSAEDFTVYYSDGVVVSRDRDEATDDKTVPFSFEVAAVPVGVCAPYDRPQTTTVFGINQSVAYSQPQFDTPLDVEYRSKSKSKLCGRVSEAFNELGHSFVVVCNLTCPNIDFQDRGKQTFDTTPFTDVVEDVIGKAVRKIERDIRPHLNALADDDTPNREETKLSGKAPQGFIKEYVFDKFEEAYARGTEGGDYTITMRQLFYVMRPMFIEAAEHLGYEYSCKATPHNPKPLELNYETFDGYVREYEEEILNERRVYREDRGFFVEPHSNRQVNLGTRAVEQYEPTSDQYGNLLFIEKSGFYELLHKEFELSKRYDIGLVNARGWANDACRNLVEKIQAANEDVTLYTLTDLDIAGVGIAADAQEAEALSAVAEFDAERIGVTLADVERYDLPVEPESYTDGQRSALETRVKHGDVNSETAEFLAADGGQRVEINAFRPPVLETYLTERFDDLGIEKVTPEPDDVETPTTPDAAEVRSESVKQAVGGYILNELRSDAVDAVRDHGDIAAADDLTDALAESDIPTGDDAGTVLHEQITEQLTEKPPESWTDINDRLVNDHEGDAEDIREEYEQQVRDAVHDLLDEHATVRVEIALDGGGGE